MLLGPRFFALIWWIYNPGRWDRSFETWLIPTLMIVFVPWTTLMYVAVYPGGIEGFDWFWIALALLADFSSYAGGGFGNRRQAAEYATRY
jgi:hypothetical protein